MTKNFRLPKYADKIKWLASDYDDIYGPDYGDMLRVSFYASIQTW